MGRQTMVPTQSATSEQWKEMSYQATKLQRGTLNAHYYVKESNLKKPPTVWFQLYDILEKAKI